MKITIQYNRDAAPYQDSTTVSIFKDGEETKYDGSYDTSLGYFKCEDLNIQSTDSREGFIKQIEDHFNKQ